MQIAGEEIERLRRQIMEQIDLTRTVEDEEVYQLIEAQVRDFARERMLTLGEREAAGRPGGVGGAPARPGQAITVFGVIPRFSAAPPPKRPPPGGCPSPSARRT